MKNPPVQLVVYIHMDMKRTLQKVNKIPVL